MMHYHEQYVHEGFFSSWTCPVEMFMNSSWIIQLQFMNDPWIENETIHDFLNSGTIHEHTSSWT